MTPENSLICTMKTKHRSAIEYNENPSFSFDEQIKMLLQFEFMKKKMFFC